MILQGLFVFKTKATEGSPCAFCSIIEGENAISNMFGWLPDYFGEANIAFFVDF